MQSLTTWCGDQRGTTDSVIERAGVGEVMEQLVIFLGNRDKVAHLDVTSAERGILEIAGPSEPIGDDLRPFSHLL